MSKLKSSDVVRVTTLILVDGKTYQPNQLVKNIPEKILNSCGDKKQVSNCEAGIAYCKDQLKAEVVDHTAKPKKEAESK